MLVGSKALLKELTTAAPAVQEICLSGRQTSTISESLLPCPQVGQKRQDECMPNIGKNMTQVWRMQGAQEGSANRETSWSY